MKPKIKTAPNEMLPRRLFAIQIPHASAVVAAIAFEGKEESVGSQNNNVTSWLLKGLSRKKIKLTNATLRFAIAKPMKDIKTHFWYMTRFFKLFDPNQSPNKRSDKSTGKK